MTQLLRLLDGGSEFFLLEDMYRKVKSGESKRPKRKGFCLVLDIKSNTEVYMSENEIVKPRIILRQLKK